ncbi:OmpA family protein [Flammeovirga kamogawensis]|uniref:OmpA family protein n=1 Tax=Flammeovirga kamogawensis TaxID=373891 RepID=A0ABX8H3V2_9BACT|nr:OmpA family protein [Flammeovirga kamogawensis]MBB6460307.1 outer membrane protein OmpA-like peptidoglycan-associated protein [Flammeovirga kamogawensis]QWG10116.1 OmpA family protein [Flammeovirga kamogawensis]TRX65624.1 OmpA family protein [Flammeovirga kamogawensis]
MKRVLFSLFFLFTILVIHAQTIENVDIKDADERIAQKFDNLDYSTALKKYQKSYRKAATKSDKIFYAVRQAECYDKMNKPKKAIKLYDEIDSLGGALKGNDAEVFGDAFFKIGKYTQAEELYDRASKGVKKEDKQRIYGKRKNIAEIEKLLSGEEAYEVKFAPFNSKQDDFSPIEYNNGIVFVSNRNENQTGKKTYVGDGGNFLDLFYVNEKGEITNLSKSINTKFHEGSASISNDGTLMVFTRSTKREKSDTNASRLQIYFSKKEGDEWGKPYPFLWNMEAYSTGHPYFSTDNKKMYYISDRPGGLGGSDIYYSEWIGEEWSRPIALGPEINTVRDELFPSLDKHNKLFFSSNGWGGLGGLDVFVQDLGNIQPSPINLRIPINSSFDDFSVLITKDGKQYISSNRDVENSKSQRDNILEIVRKDFKGIVIDKFSRVPISGATISIDGKEVSKSDSTGIFSVSFKDWNNKQNILGSKFSYQADSVLGDSIDQILINAELVVLELAQPLIKGVIYDSVSKKPLIARVIVNEKSTGKETIFYTDSVGRYQFKGLPNEHYDLRAERPRYFTNRRALNTSTKLFINKDIALEPITGQKIRIYYDFDKSDIRDDASYLLDTLVNMMTFNPTIKIELSSHTDKRGKNWYNQQLSEKRAKEAFNYAVKNGIAANRMLYKGYGESKPQIECEPCSEEEHQLNRRTEFYVTGYTNENNYFGDDYKTLFEGGATDLLIGFDGELMRSANKVISGVVQELNDEISDLELLIEDDAGTVLGTTTTSEEGVFNLHVASKYKYVLKVLKNKNVITTKYIDLYEFKNNNSIDVKVFID